MVIPRHSPRYHTLVIRILERLFSGIHHTDHYDGGRRLGERLRPFTHGVQLGYNYVWPLIKQIFAFSLACFNNYLAFV